MKLNNFYLELLKDFDLNDAEIIRAGQKRLGVLGRVVMERMLIRVSDRRFTLGTLVAIVRNADVRREAENRTVLPATPDCMFYARFRHVDLYRIVVHVD